MTKGGRGLRYELEYWLTDEDGESAFGISVITIETTQEEQGGPVNWCDVKLVETGLWTRER